MLVIGLLIPLVGVRAKKFDCQSHTKISQDSLSESKSHNLIKLLRFRQLNQSDYSRIQDTNSTMKACAQFFGPSIILKEVMEFLQSWHRCKWAYDQLPHSSGFITHERETWLRSITVQQWNQLQNMDVRSSWGRQLYLEQIELWST